MLEQVCFTPRVESVEIIDGWLVGTHAALLNQVDLVHYGAFIDRIEHAIGEGRPTATLRALEKAYEGYGLQSFRPRDAMRDFYRIKDAKDAGGFLASYGVFTLDSLSRPTKPRSVSKWWREQAVADRKPFALDLNQHFIRFRDRLKTMTRVIQSRHSGYHGDANKEADKLIYGSSDIALQLEITRHTAPSSVGFVIRNNQLHPTFMTYSVLAGLYGFLWVGYTRGARLLRTCHRSTCGRPFEATRANQGYCSVQCQQAEKSKRSRKRSLS